MKKQMLLVLSLLLLPVFANAQTVVPMGWSPNHRQTDENVKNNPFFKAGQEHYNDKWAQDLRAWGHNLDAAMQKKIDRFLGSNWAQGMQRLGRAYSKVSSEADLRRKERKNPPFSIQNIPVPARGTLGRFIYDKTETALERFTENHAMVYSWFAKLHIDVRLPDTPKEAIRNYAQNRAVIETSRLLEYLRSEPFDIHSAVTDGLSRGALEYQLCIIEAGLEACEETFRDKFGEKKVQEFENILQVREKWVYYMEKNPIFKYYVLDRNFADLQSLSQQEYETLIAFFSGKELASGWQYFLGSANNVLVNVDGYLIRHPDGFSATTVSINTIIYVKISDQLVAEISPEILKIRIYREDLTTDFNWKNSKNL